MNAESDKLNLVAHSPEDDGGIVDGEVFRAALGALTEKIEATFGPLHAIAEHFARTLQPFVEAVDRLAPSLRSAVLTMAEAGWYYDPGIGLILLTEVSDLLSAGQTEYANEALCEYFENRLSRLEADIISEFPHRANPIQAAFRAHHDGEYFLSVPVLLAQADGICVDVTTKSLYGKLRGKPVPQTRSFLDDIDAGEFAKALLSPLAEPLPISASESQRGPDWDALNRHQVMHGESVDYGTRVNSLKAVSLLGFIAQAKDAVRHANS